MNIKVLPITLLTGYLGSGKTTLINHILNNQKGYKIAVIVNDIGEVNIDAELIQKGGVVTEKDDNLVALSNGCICCTLKTNLMEQIAEIYDMDKFDYLLIEASGICEPIPIAQSIMAMNEMMEEQGIPPIVRLDSVISVTDSLRLAQEFECGDNLIREGLEDDDIENLIIQQIEFCNLIILNKVDEVTKEELGEVKAVIKKLQPKAKIIETNYSKVDLDDILNVKLFDFEETLMSSGWSVGIENDIEEHHHCHHSDEDHECCSDHGHDYGHECCCRHKHDNKHECCCGHHNNNGEGELLEYGISTFVYYVRSGLERKKFQSFIKNNFDKSIIRCKGVLYFNDEDNMCYMFEQAGSQKTLMEAGEWFVMLPKKEQDLLRKQEPKLDKDWDDEVGDRMVKLVFIGKNMDKEKIISNLDLCLKK